MTNHKKGFLRWVALCLILSFCVSLAACKGQEDTPTETTEQSRVEHTVTVKSQGGQPLVDVGVGVYTDATLNELVWFAKTDGEGKITFRDIPGDSYVAVLSNLPEGYLVEEQYSLTGTETEIVLTAFVSGSEPAPGTKYALGDVMSDFTVTAADGTAYTLSELLQGKQAVVLNFWYLQCDPCKMEFPYLQAAYEKYSDSVEVLALNPYNTDPQEVGDFRTDNGYTFPMMIADPEWAEKMELTAYPTTVVIDRCGTIAMIHKGSITQEGVFESIFAFFGAEDYRQTIVSSVEELPPVEETEEQDVGTASNPIEIGATQSFTVTVPAGGEVHLDIYRVSSHYLHISSPYATITYNGRTYSPSNGAVGVGLYADDMMTAVRVVIGNMSSEEQTFTVTMSTAKGSYGNPYTMELGQFNVTVAAGSEQGVYYTYTAPEDGELTVKILSVTSGVPYDLVLYNLSTYVYNNLQSNPQKDADGYYYLSVNVKTGNKIQLICGSLPDDSGSYPKVDFTLHASMGESSEEEKEEKVTMLYAVTVTDENRNPVPGVQIYLDVNGESKNIATNGDGNAYTRLEPGTYSATLKIPVGYEARTTVFRLTEAIPTIAVKLDTIVVETETYTIHVVDEDNGPVAGALVSIGDVFGYTDETGAVSFSLGKGSYTVAVSAEGYTDTAASFFGEATEMTVTLVKGEEDVENGVTYSVTVVDYFGNPQTNVTVSFQKNGTTVAMKAADAAGVASRVLEAGSYTVSLAFASGSYYYAPLTLTAEAPTGVVTAVAKRSGDYVSTYMGDMYSVTPGATYGELQSGVTNYFLFAPTEAGYYSFTTADPSDVISYWGGNLFYITDQTASVEYVNNTFMLNIKQEAVDSGLAYNIGVTGDADCILVIRRLGDAKTDFYDLPWSTEWMEGVELPAETITVSETGTLTYMDVSRTYELVLGSDGCYHVGSADGPVLYLRLDEFAPYISFEDLLANGGMKVYFFDEDGTFLKKEEYTDYMNACVTNMDAVNGLYPVTETVGYILQTYGAYVEWYDAESSSYLFGEIAADPNSAWLFACCYFA